MLNEEYIMRLIAKIIVSFKYAMIFWALWVFFDPIHTGIVFLAKFLIYFKILYLILIGIAFMILFSEIGYRPGEKEKTKNLKEKILAEIPILGAFENHKAISIFTASLPNVLVLYVLYITNNTLFMPLISLVILVFLGESTFKVVERIKYGN